MFGCCRRGTAVEELCVVPRDFAPKSVRFAGGRPPHEGTRGGSRGRHRFSRRGKRLLLLRTIVYGIGKVVFSFYPWADYSEPRCFILGGAVNAIYAVVLFFVCLGRSPCTFAVHLFSDDATGKRSLSFVYISLFGPGIAVFKTHTLIWSHEKCSLHVQLCFLAVFSRLFPSEFVVVSVVLFCCFVQITFFGRKLLPRGIFGFDAIEPEENAERKPLLLLFSRQV